MPMMSQHFSLRNTTQCAALSLCLVASLVGASAQAEEQGYLDTLKRLTAPEPKPVSIGVPSGFGAARGLLFGSVAYTDQDRNTGVADDEDGSIAIGFGLGNPAEAVAVEVTIGITSVSTGAWGDGVFGDSGNLGLKLHRHVAGPASARIATLALGVNNLLSWGETADVPQNVYLVYSQISDLRFGQAVLPMNVTLGGGSAISNVDRDPGVFASVGFGLSPDFSAGLGWYGDEWQIGAVFFPRFMPAASIAVTHADATRINSPEGRWIVSLNYAVDRWVK